MFKLFAKMTKLSTLLAFVLFLGLAPAQADDKNIPNEARAFYSQYVLLTTQFSPELLEMYKPDADIQGWHKDQRTGKIAKIKYTAEQQRKMFAETVPQLKAMNARAEFGKPVFKREGKGVRINVEFSTILNSGTIPGQISLLTEPDDKGVWKVAQELTFSASGQ